MPGTMSLGSMMQKQSCRPPGVVARTNTATEEVDFFADARESSDAESVEEPVPEFLNDIFQQMWPFIAEYIEDILRNTVEPAVQRAMPTALKSFCFSKDSCQLSRETPPYFVNMVSKIRPVTTNTYGETRNLRLVAECRYDGNCDIEIQALGAWAGVSQIRLHGDLVIEFVRLLPRPPMFSGLRIYFTNPPEVGLTMGGGLGSVANLSVIKKQILGVVSQQIGNVLVLPNRIAVALQQEENVFRIKAPRPEGVLRVRVEEARGLKPVDFSMFNRHGTSDPYCVITFGATTWRTPARKL